VTPDESKELAGDNPKNENPEEPIVRPLNYVEDEPIIRRIGDRNLYLGNWLAAEPTSHDRTFGSILSVSTDEYPLTTHHHPLDDGPDNKWAVFERAVDVARQLHRQDGSLLIHCTAGISRSSALTAVVIAAEENRPFREALDIVQQARPSAMPHPALHELAVIYLADNEEFVDY